MEIQIIHEKISMHELKQLAEATFGDMVKGVVDVQRKIIALGGSMHADAEAVLLGDGSKQEHIWGFNIYPDLPENERLQFESLINIRPKQNNRTMEVVDPALREVISRIVNALIE